MAVSRTPGFGDLLRRYRNAAGLTQEELAGRAGLSPKGISDLERGARRSPRRDTVALVAEALGLTEREREVLASAARLGRQASAGGRWAGRPPASRDAAGDGLVGRSVELAALEAHLSVEGPPLLLFAGEPGIGKSRLLGEALARGPARGWATLAGGCHRRSGQEPFAPFVDALARHVASLSPRERGAALSGCSWLARLLPELAELIAPAATGWNLSPEQERRLVFGAVARYLANAAGPAGALLVLDDLQWAGQDALDLLAYLVRAMPAHPLRIVGAYRDTDVRTRDALPALVVDLAREGLASRLLLAPLDAADAARLLDALLPEGAAQELDGAALRRRVLDRTGGVPFFLVSCAQALESGSLEGGGGPEEERELPWSVAETIRQRVGVLPEAARTLLEIAAVAGRVTRRDVLVAVAAEGGREEPEALAGLDAALHARLLDEAGEQSYAFAHDLIREAVGAGVGAARAGMLHRQIAQALERTPGRAPVADLAYHFGRSDDQEKAVRYLEAAADQALSRYANAEAALHYRELVARLEGLARPEEAARAWERLAAALTAMGRYVEAQAALEPAAAAYRAAGAVERQAGALAQEGALYARRGLPEEGLARLAPFVPVAQRLGPSPALATFYGALSWLEYAAKRFPEQLAAADRAVEIARASGDERSLLTVEIRRSVALTAAGRLEEAERHITERVLPLAEKLGDLAAQRAALNNLGVTYGDRGEYAKERLLIERALALAEQIGDDADIALAVAHLGDLAFVTGDWRAARAEQERALELMRRVDAWMWSAMPTAALGVLSIAQGDAAAGLRSLEDVRRQGERAAESVIWLEVALAERDLLDGRAATARERVRMLLEEPHRSNASFLEPRALLACILVHTGDAAAGTALAGEVVALARELNMHPALADALRYAGWVALERGRWGEAEEALEESLALARPMPRPYSEAKALYVFGLLHARRGEPDRAGERWRAALAICGRLGERLYAEHVKRGLEAAGAR